MVPKSFFLLPGHSLDDFPTQLAGYDAANLLAVWTAAWHPAVISVCNDATSIMRAGIDIPDEAGSIIFVPEVSKRYLDEEFFKNAKDHQVRLIQATNATDARHDLVIEMIRIVPEFGEAARRIPNDLVSDFFALSYAYLQVQVMTRQLRYSTNLNQERFSESLLRAAQHAALADPDACHKELIICFDLLMNERSCYYPIQPQLVDIVLLAETTLKKSLNQQLESQHKLNLALTGKTAESLLTVNENALGIIKKRLCENRISIVGGLQMELSEPLLSSESCLRQIKLGKQTMSRVFSAAPRFFARRRSGLTPFLPALLERFDFAGAVHASFDGNPVPVGSNSNIRWTGADDGAISASAVPITDATEPGNFLGLGRMIGKQLDSSHTAVCLFAHWPNRTCESFQDLINVQKFAPVLGEFVTLEQYFESIYDPGFGDQFEHSEYIHAYLQQMIEEQIVNPISRFADYWHHHHQLLQCRALLVHVATICRDRSGVEGGVHADFSAILSEIEALERRLDEEVDASSSFTSELQLKIDKLIGRMIETCSMRQPDANHEKATHSHNFILNTLNFKRRTRLDVSLTEIGPQKENGPIRFADHRRSAIAQQGLNKVESTLVVDLAGNGIVVLPAAPANSDPFRDAPDLIEGMTLKNEFLLIEVDPKSGGIKALMTHYKRQNLASQKLAARLPANPGNSPNPIAGEARYTEMVATDIEPVVHSKIEASIRSKGNLLDGEKVIANFQQTITITRGLPTAEIEVEFTFPEPWPINRNQYLCSRLAWSDENSQLKANFQEGNFFTSGEWIYGTQFIQIPQEEHSVTLLTGGLPFHRRSARRMLDTLLVVGNERRRMFRFGLGLNLQYPILTAASRSTPVLVVSSDRDLLENRSDWNFHFDRKNVLVTFWEPEFDINSDLTGVQIRLRETEGRSGELTISRPHPITSASQVDFEGAFLRSIPVDPHQPNRISVSLGNYEQIQVSIVL